MTTTECVTTMNRKDKLQSLMAQMSDGLLEREHQVRLMLLAALSGEHVLLVGPPGTAKSELAKRLKNAFVEANYFERLVTRFSVPEELFGPLSIRALEEDRYNRLTSGYLPEASVAFIDEIFKANSAILNSLLTLLNERQFDNGNRRVDVPLISVVAASNELPDSEELSALYDRFILRSYVSPVSNDSFDELINGVLKNFDPELNIRLKVEDLNEVQRLADKVELTIATREACKEFRNYLASQDIYVSDRRWRKLVKLMKVSAFTSGFNETSIYDTWILPHCLWEQPEQFEGLQELYKQLVTVNGKTPPSRLLQVIKAWEERLKEDQKTHKHDAQGRPLYLDRDGEETFEEVSKYQKKDEDGDLLYMDEYGEETHQATSFRRKNEPIFVEVKNTPISLNRSFSKDHIEGRVREVQSIRNNIEAYYNHVNKELSEVSGYFDRHLWLDKNLLSEVTDALQASIKEVDKLLNRATSLESGFKNLPLEAEPVLALEPEDCDAIEGELCE
ncbi:AAA family ATPase [Vibrio parahaemolyticus]|uniref:AAA family ATPase n=1 Tax=Vibrio parahaemolyticus TaxID=670 RepID=UPI001C6014DF|nr:AAA family ATPase [Vibrio parahaemolyticus]EHR0871465.1 AAA family ATPase [Vibrio parahaemolyticus]EID4327576.1 AAA family ATPase [Vibrio parahaemolyticus]HCH5319965.1 AAA family ATPase [Vibrio parahaemolyticus]